PANSATADIAIVTVADASIRKLITREGPDTRPIWSPDGSRIAFQTPNAPGAPSFANHNIAVIPASGGAIEPLTASFDENPSLEAWKPSGIFFSASQHTWSYLYRLDPAAKTTTRLAPADEWIGSSFTFSRDGSSVAFLGADAKTMPEVYAGHVGAGAELRVGLA